MGNPTCVCGHSRGLHDKQQGCDWSFCIAARQSKPAHNRAISSRCPCNRYRATVEDDPEVQLTAANTTIAELRDETIDECIAKAHETMLGNVGKTIGQLLIIRLRALKSEAGEGGG